MSRNTLPKLPILGYRKDGRPIFPIKGGSEPLTAEQQAAAAQAAADAAKNTGPVEATDETGVSLGFPKDTAVADMTDKQASAYWRHQTKVQQRRVPGNLTQLEADAAELARIKASQQTPAEQQLQAARDEAAAATRAEVGKEAALALLRVSLHTRGKSDAEIDELLVYTSADSFLTNDKKLDAGKVTSYVDKIAPSGSGGGGGLPGQGRQEQQATDSFAKGAAEAERRGYKPADRSQSSLIPR